MNAAEVPEELVEAGARAIHEVDCCPLGDIRTALARRTTAGRRDREDELMGPDDEAAAEAERRLLETAEWVPVDLDELLRPPPAVIRTPGGLVLDWGWRRLVIGRRAWLPMGHPKPTWRVGPIAYYGVAAWDGTTEEAS